MLVRLARWRGSLAEEIACQKYQQWQFFEQWLAVKEYANERGVRIIGDIPIFVSLDSVDVWANPHLFHLDENLHMYKELPVVKIGEHSLARLHCWRDGGWCGWCDGRGHVLHVVDFDILGAAGDPTLFSLQRGGALNFPPARLFIYANSGDGCAGR